MFEKLVKYIEDTELTVLEGATIEFEPVLNYFGATIFILFLPKLLANVLG